MAWVRGLQDKEGVLQGCWLDIKAVFTTCLWECDSTAQGLNLRKRLKCVHVCVLCVLISRLEGASESTLSRGHHSMSSILLTLSDTLVSRTHTNAWTLFLVSVLVSPDAPASGISSVSHVTGWRCDSCPYARLSLAKVTTHTNTLILKRYTGALLQG